MDSSSPETDPPTGEDFVHIENPAVVVDSLSDSIVRVDVPREDDDDDNITVRRPPEAEASEQRRVLPDELSRSVTVLSCESSANYGVCDVYLVGTAHVSMVICLNSVNAVSKLRKMDSN